MSSHLPHIRKVNDYLLKAALGRSISSRVYLGIEASTGLRYTIKRVKLDRLSRSSCGIAQLEREIRLMKILNHPNIIKMKEVLFVEPEREVFLVLEYAKHGCLSGFIDRSQQLNCPSILSILKQTVIAIKYLHENGLVHQDVKPWNILIDEIGRVILADFGIGHAFQSAKMISVCPAFQAPEVAEDDDSEEDIKEREQRMTPQKEDIWALGVTVYLLLFRKVPFPGENLYEIVNYIQDHELEIPECDPGVNTLLRGMLAVDPSKRLGIDELIENPLIKSAPDLASDLPEVPEPEFLEGEVCETEAIVCPREMSFANMSKEKLAQLSFTHVPFSARGSRKRSLPGVWNRLSDIDSSYDEELVMSSPVLRK